MDPSSTRCPVRARERQVPSHMLGSQTEVRRRFSLNELARISRLVAPLRSTTPGQGRCRFSVFQAERHNAPTDVRLTAAAAREPAAKGRYAMPDLISFRKDRALSTTHGNPVTK